MKKIKKKVKIKKKIKFRTICENLSPTRNIKYKKIDFAQLGQISFLQPIWNNFKKGVDLSLHVNSVKNYSASFVPN